MDDFDNLFKTALEAVAGGFAAARADLDGILGALNASLKAQAGDRFELVVDEVEQNMKSALYRVFLDPDIEDFDSVPVSIAYFKFSSKGYPLMAGWYSKSNDTFVAREAIQSKNELEAFFKGLLSNPDSTLIQAVGFALRKAKKSG